MVDQYVANLRRNNAFELYAGDHVSAVADRMQNHVLPFFSQHLAFETKPRK